VTSPWCVSITPPARAVTPRCRRRRPPRTRPCRPATLTPPPPQATGPAPPLHALRRAVCSPAQVDPLPLEPSRHRAPRNPAGHREAARARRRPPAGKIFPPNRLRPPINRPRASSLPLASPPSSHKLSLAPPPPQLRRRR
jgi:hypothetical protein